MKEKDQAEDTSTSTLLTALSHRIGSQSAAHGGFNRSIEKFGTSEKSLVWIVVFLAVFVNGEIPVVYRTGKFKPANFMRSLTIIRPIQEQIGTFEPGNVLSGTGQNLAVEVFDDGLRCKLNFRGNLAHDLVALLGYGCDSK